LITKKSNKKIFGIIIKEEIRDEIREKDIMKGFQELKNEMIRLNISNRNRIGIGSSEETKPGVFIGSCLVEPEEYTCPVSVINTTKESVEITTPLVTVDKLRVSNRASILVLQKAKSDSYESTIYKNEKKIYTNSYA